MYIEYKGQLYNLVENIFIYNKPALTTHFKEKTDDTFYETSGKVHLFRSERKKIKKRRRIGPQK